MKMRFIRNRLGSFNRMSLYYLITNLLESLCAPFWTRNEVFGTSFSRCTHLFCCWCSYDLLMYITHDSCTYVHTSPLYVHPSAKVVSVPITIIIIINTIKLIIIVIYNPVNPKPQNLSLDKFMIKFDSWISRKGKQDWQ